MIKLLLVKLRRDLRTTWGRVAMMVAAISLSLIVFSTVLFALAIVQSNMTSGYMSTNPASARISLDQGVPTDQAEATLRLAKADSSVIDAAMRSVLNLKIPKGDGDSTPLQLFVAAPNDPMRIANFKIEQGSWPVAKDTILLERSTVDFFKLKVGDNITVATPSGKSASLKIGGVVHDQSLAPASTGQQANGYISTDSLPSLGLPATLDQLAITVGNQTGATEPSHNRDAIVQTALGVADRVKEARQVQIEQVAVPPPYEHPHQSIVSTLLGALLAFGALALLLSAILIATMFNGLLTQQIPQIGMMKAIGARSGRILQLYLVMVLGIAVLATILAFAPALALGRMMAQVVLSGAVNIDVTNLSIPWWIYATAASAGILVPLMLALIPIVRASRRTVREAFDERGVDSQSSKKAGLLAWLGRLRGMNSTTLMAFRNIFRRRARFFFSVGLLAVAGAIFIGALNMSAGIKAIPNTIADEQHWHIAVKLSTPADAAKATATASQVAHATTVEAWNTVPTSVQYAGQTSVTRTYPDEGHGSLNLSAIPGETSTLTPPAMLEGRWLNADDTDAIVLNQTIRKTLPGVKVGDILQLPIDDTLTTWHVVGIAKELAGGTCPCVSQKGFEQAVGRQGQTNLLRITTDRHDSGARVADGQAIVQALAETGIKAQAKSFDAVIESTEGHTDVLLILILSIAISIGLVGLIGLGSTMSTNVVERTREFGVMSAIGATPAKVRNLVILEGIFIAITSLVVAVIPAWLVTVALSTGLGELFFSASVPIQISLQAIVIWTIVVIVGAAIATWAPASRASRLTVREALAYI